MWAWGYVSLLNSESYSFANQYLEANLKVRQIVGKIESHRPGFANFSQSYAAGIWRDSFNIILNGDKNSAVVYVKLEGTGSGWKMNSAILRTSDAEIDLIEK